MPFADEGGDRLCLHATRHTVSRIHKKNTTHTQTHKHTNTGFTLHPLQRPPPRPVQPPPSLQHARASFLRLCHAPPNPLTPYLSLLTPRSSLPVLSPPPALSLPPSPLSHPRPPVWPSPSLLFVTGTCGPAGVRKGAEYSHRYGCWQPPSLLHGTHTHTHAHMHTHTLSVYTQHYHRCGCVVCVCVCLSVCVCVCAALTNVCTQQDDNLFHISFESGVLEDPAATPPDSTHRSDAAKITLYMYACIYIYIYIYIYTCICAYIYKHVFCMYTYI